MTHIAVIGGGVIGGGWAARFLLNGRDVKVYDPDPEAERKISVVLDNARGALPMLYETRLPPEGALSFVESLEDAVRDALYIQESVPEQLELKRRLYAQIEAVEDVAVIGSSTSGFKPSELAAEMADPHRLVVAHPFNPVYLLPLVELVGPMMATSRVEDLIDSIGMYPLVLDSEIDGHVADRLLEAVWREALWLVHDGVATTRDIDEVIRMGFGLRWAQMGLFETYRIAGGEGGMAHFLRQFGPALKWPWTKLMDVPELTEDLVRQIEAQSDAQSGAVSIRELERLRDRNLVALLRALKAEGSGAGAVIAAHDQSLARPDKTSVPMITIARVIPSDWTDYNGHMNESRYGQLWSDAADAVLAQVGAGMEYVARGLSYFTVETKTRFVLETHASEVVRCETRVTLGEGKKLGLSHEMKRASDGALLANCDQFLVHVSLETRKSCLPEPDVLAAVEALAEAHR
ncbi:MAG: carnitine 3-dehydrogenase [Pseudomonadota bacterium]